MIVIYAMAIRRYDVFRKGKTPKVRIGLLFRVNPPPPSL